MIRDADIYACIHCTEDIAHDGAEWIHLGTWNVDCAGSITVAEQV